MPSGKAYVRVTRLAFGKISLERFEVILLKVYIGISFLMTLLVMYKKWANKARTVSPINGSVDQNFERYYHEFSKSGYRVEEYVLLDGRKLTIFLNHPWWGYFFLMGLILLMFGLVPGIIWLYNGRDRLSLTFKENAGYVLYVFETNHNKYASNLWYKMNSKLTRELLGTSSEDLKTTIEFYQ